MEDFVAFFQDIIGKFVKFVLDILHVFGVNTDNVPDYINPAE